MCHVLGALAVDLYQLVPHPQPPVHGCRAIYSHPEYEERHAVELSATTDTEPEPSLSSLQLHGKVLLLLSKVGVHLLVLSVGG